MKSPFHTETRQDESAERLAGDGVAASPAAGGLDAPPSNRASNRCNQVRFQVLSRHVDSLEVSVPGQLRPDRGQELEKLKELAQSRQEEIRAQAQLVVAGRCFEVRDKGAGMFPFVLNDDRYYIKLSRLGNTSLPLAYCQIRNAHLLHVGPREAVADLRRVLNELGEFLGREIVSRVDLAVDFVTGHPIEAWPAESWVTRLDYKHSYSDGDHFTGWSIGRKSSLQFGLYDKTHEIETVSHKEYLYELWDKAGWAPWDSVWRAEARLRRTTLAQFGLSSLDDVIAAAGDLWRYVTGTSIRLTTPSATDDTRSRWSNQPLWDELSGVDWGLPPIGLIRAYKGLGAPTDRSLARLVKAALTSLMAREGLLEVGPAWNRLREVTLSDLLTRETVTGLTPEEALVIKAQEKGRRWHTLQNVTAAPAVPPQGRPAPQAWREPGSA